MLVLCCCRVVYKKIQQTNNDIDVFLHVILSNFGVFAARGVPPDPDGEEKEKIRKRKTRIFNKVDFSLIL